MYLFYFKKVQKLKSQIIYRWDSFNFQSSWYWTSMMGMRKKILSKVGFLKYLDNKKDIGLCNIN